ncbi:ABC transporter ATP-binding protein [Ruania zhangjianzhongii]|uniref:ABC transporter ATP-binding protein n=1 Tax=Ruania zhangjianzhongii TaxID=2603206 RepID=UPI0011CCC22D|nr:ABC transporter ATP-binding protein [Ruania zhangjianzhongii]
MNTTTAPVPTRQTLDTGPSAVDLTAATKSFGHTHAVRGVALHVRPGEVVALLGPNGAGKTTTLDLILGLSTPTTGQVSVYGMTPRTAVARGLVAAVLQTGGLLPDLTVKEMVTYTACLFAQTRPVAEVLDHAGIIGIAGRKVGKCSGGEQQRLRFAMALLADPALLVLDEPTTGMDVAGRRRFWQSIRTDVDAGRTVLFATHYLEEADVYADRIVLMARGLVVADGTTAEVKALASGRTVRATVPGGLPTDELHRLGDVPGVDTVEARGESVLVHTADSDAVARYLLDVTTACDLEITARALEDAFVSLTAAPAAAAAPTRSAAPAPTSTNDSSTEGTDR